MAELEDTARYAIKSDPEGTLRWLFPKLSKDLLYERFLELVEPPLLRAMLEQSRGNRAVASERLGIHRATLRQKLRRYGIE